VWTDALRLRLVDRPVLARYLELRNRIFPGMGPSVTAYGSGLNVLRRYEQVLADCGDDARSVCDALLHLGRATDCRTRFGQVNWIDGVICKQTGELEAIVTRHPGQARNEALAKLGRIGEALHEAGAHPAPEILTAAGDWPALLKRDPTGSDGDVLARFASGRIAEAVEGAYLSPPERSRYALLLLGRQSEAEATALDTEPNLEGLRLLAALAAGDKVTAGRWRTVIAGHPVSWVTDNEWFTAYVILPLLARADGDQKAWDAAMAEGMRVRARAGQRLWHLASFITGKIDLPTMRAQPYRAESEAWQRIGEGLRGEIAGDKMAARTAYAAFQALPIERRLLQNFRLDPTIERFVDWRMQELGAP